MEALRPGFVSRLSIAVIGPDDLVERVMLTARHAPQSTGDWQLVAAGYRDEEETPDLLGRLRGRIDACLFTGPLPHDIARESGSLTVPATFIPLNDAALYSTLLRGVADEICEMTRVGIDTLSREEVEEAYAEIGAPIDRVRVHPYRASEPASTIAEFHRRLWEEGTISAAVTCVRSVWQRLGEAGVPALRVMPTRASIRSALRTAALMGAGTHLADAQIAVALVRMPSASAADPLYGQQELALSLHQLLLRAARPMGATVQPVGDETFQVVTTVGALAASTGGFRVAPFLDRAREALGVSIHVGVGIGGTAQEATASAQASLTRARETGPEGFALQHGSKVLVLPAAEAGAGPAAPPPAPTSEAAVTLARLVDVLGRSADGEAHVVGADEVAELLAISPRSARRALAGMVDEGLAWRLPPDRSPQRGRPRRRYRLVAERLTGRGREQP